MTWGWGGDSGVGAGPPDPVLTGSPGQPLRTWWWVRGDGDTGSVDSTRCSVKVFTFALLQQSSLAISD